MDKRDREQLTQAVIDLVLAGRNQADDELVELRARFQSALNCAPDASWSELITAARQSRLDAMRLRADIERCRKELAIAVRDRDEHKTDAELWRKSMSTLPLTPEMLGKVAYEQTEAPLLFFGAAWVVGVGTEREEDLRRNIEVLDARLRKLEAKR